MNRQHLHFATVTYLTMWEVQRVLRAFGRGFSSRIAKVMFAFHSARKDLFDFIFLFCKHRLKQPAEFFQLPQSQIVHTKLSNRPPYRSVLRFCIEWKSAALQHNKCPAVIGKHGLYAASFIVPLSIQHEMPDIWRQQCCNYIPCPLGGTSKFNIFSC